MSHLTSEAKTKLSSTIRQLRDRLLRDIHDTADSTYRLSLTIEKAGLAEEERVKRSRLEQWLKEQERDSAIALLEAENSHFASCIVLLKNFNSTTLYQRDFSDLSQNTVIVNSQK